LSEYDREYYELGTKSGYRDYSWKRLGSMFQSTAKHIVNHFHPARLLDVGCAKGFLVKSLVDLGIDAEGLDVSEYAISHCHPDVKPRVRLGDIADLPYGDKSFDVVTCLDVLEHLDHPEIAVKDLERVSTKWILVHVWTAGSPDGLDVTHRRPPKKRSEYVKMFSNDWQSLEVKPYLDASWFRNPNCVVIMRRIESEQQDS